MKTVIRMAIAAALAVGASSGAFAQATADSNHADLWVFVSDSANHETFAWDTGVLVSSEGPATYTAGSTANNSTSGNDFSVTSSALASFVAGKSASTLNWGIVGVNFDGATNGAASVTGANGSVLTAYSYASGTQGKNIAAGYIGANLQTTAQLFNGDESLFQFFVGSANGGNNEANGGASAAIAWSDINNQVWGSGSAGATSGPVAGSTDLYGGLGTGLNQLGTLVGSSQALYLLANDGEKGNVLSYDLGSVTLGADGTLTAVAPAPVPVPAAVWLFGSGLLGLMGVGRRRTAV